MALSAQLQWYMRADGAELNGGGFDPTLAGAGTNYSDQAAAQLSITDGATSGAGSTTLASAAALFTSVMVGNVIRISAGTNFQTGYYMITTFTDSSHVVLDRTPSSGGAGSGGTGRVGGAHVSFASYANGGNSTTPIITSPLAAGHTINVRGAGTDDPSTPDYTTTNFWQFVNGDMTSGPVTVVGYNGRPFVQGNGLTFWNLTFWRFRHFKVGATGTMQFQQFGMICGASGGVSPDTNANNGRIALDDVIFDQAGKDVACSSTCQLVVRCWAKNTGTISAGTYPTFGNAFHGGAFVANLIQDQRNLCAIGTSQLGSAVGNLITGCKGSDGGIKADYDGLTNNPEPIGQLFWHNTVDANTGPGLNIKFVGSMWGMLTRNNIFSNCSTYGIDVPNTIADKAISTTPDYNAFYNNTTADRHFISAGAHDVALSASPYVGGGDFNLNATASGGAACRNAGWPGAFKGGTMTGAVDIGAVQHAESLIVGWLGATPPPLDRTPPAVIGY